MAISVACSCGVRVKTTAENAGCAAPCPQCGQTLRAPSADAATGRPDALETIPANIDGCEEHPSPASTRPCGAPKSEAKKRIAKRPFAGASVALSVLTVVAIALLGWRIYGVMHRVGRAAAEVSASVELAPAAENAITVEMDRAAEQMIKDPRTVEARQWLDPARYPNHVILEMGDEQARIMVEGFYDRGAEGVYVLEPSTLGDSVVTSQIAVKLPADPAMRQDCLTWAAPYLEADGPIPDDGQTYVMVSTD